ncbi:MAG: ribbon-helix-helix protein, CopG family [Opitutales bacterium]
MKPITLYVSEPTYRAFKEAARRQDRTASELIREAMEAYRQQWTTPTQGLEELSALSVGTVRRALGPDDDLLEEMGDGAGD